jgi:hypothetical protein
MLDHETKSALLRLHDEGRGPRESAEALESSRGSARRVLERGHAARAAGKEPRAHREDRDDAQERTSDA